MSKEKNESVHNALKRLLTNSVMEIRESVDEMRVDPSGIAWHTDEYEFDKHGLSLKVVLSNFGGGDIVYLSASSSSPTGIPVKGIGDTLSKKYTAALSKLLKPIMSDFEKKVNAAIQQAAKQVGK